MTDGLPLIPGFLERWIRNWSDKRYPEPKHEIDITRKRLYILPTRHGLAYFAVLLLVLFGAINYENNLGFMLTFLLGSIGFLGMLYTHQNINNITIRVGRTEPVFAGQHILLPLYISQNKTTNNNASMRIAIQFSGNDGDILNLNMDTQNNGKLSLLTQKRGYFQPGRIKVFTEYPLGLFHAWSWLYFDTQCIVYPAADTNQHPLQTQLESKQQNSNNNDMRGVDDFAGIRNYQSGDTPNHMAWKAIAKTGELQTKLFNTDASRKISIQWSDTDETLDIESRLSILCRMIIEADEHSYDYKLEIPGCKIDIGNGLQHKHRCLKALALFGTQI